jgi:hypothetical protein
MTAEALAASEDDLLERLAWLCISRGKVPWQDKLEQVTEAAVCSILAQLNADPARYLAMPPTSEALH